MGAILEKATALQAMALREIGSGAGKPCTATNDHCIQIAQEALVITSKVGALLSAFAALMTPEESKAFDRFCECCEDFDAQGHDVPAPMMQRLQLIGLVTHIGWGRYETTDFGDIVRDGVIAALA
jgi:hypothetical protein